jgi:hypothetical protein
VTLILFRVDATNNVHQLDFNKRILDLRSFTEADCDTDQYPVVTKVRESLPVSK